MAQHHQLDPALKTVHWGIFDAKLPHVLQVESGDTVTVDTVSGWSDVADLSLMTSVHREIVTTLKPGFGPTC